ncbi:Multidrug transporter MdtC [Cronobacter sakazakii]|nr:Multidrug transporter MdtC [Cronobacter sakazakii]
MTANRWRGFGISVQDANSLLNNAFGQRQISTIYQPLNQYKVVMEVDPALHPGYQRARSRCS